MSSKNQPVLKPRRHTKRQNNKKQVADGVHEIGGRTVNDDVELLRSFDLDYRYGPCVGIKRIVRWERAKSLGLNPPPVIKDILLANPTLRKYQESLFDEYSRVM